MEISNAKYVMIISKSGRAVGVPDGDSVCVYSPETRGGLQVTKVPAGELQKFPLNMFPGFTPYVVNPEGIMRMQLMDATGECKGAFARVPERIMKQLKAAHELACRNGLIS